MKIIHTYCLNYNIGDYYLGIGVKNLLRHYLDVELIAETNIQGQVFNEYYIENVINKKYDLLVIGGGGVIHGAHWPNGWFWLIKQELIKKIKIPFIVYGVGYNYFEDELGIPEIGRQHLMETINRAAYFSVRNDGSQERLNEQLDILVPEIPDPGFHINLERTYSCKEKKPFIMIQLADDKPEYRFKGAVIRSDFVFKMRRIVDDLRRRYKVILSPHVYEDVEISRLVSEGFDNVCVWDYSRYAFDRVAESLGYYQQAEFVIAMRGHGQIVPCAFNTPVISLENHPKHVGLMRKIGIEKYNVSITKCDLESKLMEVISLVESNKKCYRNQLLQINQNISEQTKKAFIQIKQKLDLFKGYA
jgi:polysaccharide pyruvyl transferase WcaK-like protein